MAGRAESPSPHVASRSRLLVNASGAVQGGIARVAVCIASTASQSMDVQIELAPGGVIFPPECTVISRQWSSRARTVLSSAWSATVHRRPDCDVVVSVAPAICRRGGRATIQICNDLAYRDVRNAHVTMVQRIYRAVITPLAFARSDVIVAISEHTADEIRRAFPRFASKVRVLPLPVKHIVDAAAGLGVLNRSDLDAKRERGTRIFAFGHAPNKGVELLLSLANARPDIHLRILSTESFWQQSGLAQRATEMGLGCRLTILHGVTDAELAREYIGADVFCMPSRYEGYGLPVAEALALGVPTVISPLPVLAATARGHAIEMSEFSVAALASAVECALSRSRQHWADARAEFAHFGWDEWVRSAGIVQ